MLNLTNPAIDKTESQDGDTNPNGEMNRMTKCFIPRSVRQNEDVQAMFAEREQRRELVKQRITSKRPLKKCKTCFEYFKPVSANQVYCHNCSIIRQNPKGKCIYCGKILPYERHSSRFCNDFCCVLYCNSGVKKQ